MLACSVGLSLVVAFSGWAQVVVAADPNQNRTIHWAPCKEKTTRPASCGTLEVPIDYNNSSSKTFTLNLLRYEALEKPCKGSVLFNPGGPGESSRNTLDKFAEEFLIAVGGHHDMIAFDTRGTSSLPFSCFADSADRLAQQALLPSSSNSSDVSLAQLWAGYGALAELCYEKNKDIIQYIGTESIARDMMQIVDALGEDGLLRYYGLSYGTVLGATVAAMFPDRMDKLILDGVVNSHLWYDGTNTEEAAEADDTIRQFLKVCLDNQDACPIQRKKGTTADELFGEVQQMFEHIKFHPEVLGPANLTTGLLRYDQIKTGFVTGVKGSYSGGLIAALTINGIMEKNYTQYAKGVAALAAESPTPFPVAALESLYGIQCGDVALRADKLETVQPIVDQYYEQSYFGGDLLETLLFACAQWKTKSKSTYSGPFKGKTKTPILFISSPYDPSTPMVSARNMSAGFEGSVVLQQNGIGHTSLANPSKCSIQASAAYFNNGILPKAGTVCEPYNYFTNMTFLELFRDAIKA